MGARSGPKRVGISKSAGGDRRLALHCRDWSRTVADIQRERRVPRKLSGWTRRQSGLHDSPVSGGPVQCQSEAVRCVRQCARFGHSPSRRTPSWLSSRRTPSWLSSRRTPSWLSSRRASEWLSSRRTPSWLSSRRASAWLSSRRTPSWLSSRRTPGSTGARVVARHAGMSASPRRASRCPAWAHTGAVCAERVDCPAVLAQGSHRGTRCVRCALCARTTAMRVLTKRAARADPWAALLGTPEIAPAGQRLARRCAFGVLCSGVQAAECQRPAGKGASAQAVAGLWCAEKARPGHQQSSGRFVPGERRGRCAACPAGRQRSARSPLPVATG